MDNWKNNGRRKTPARVVSPEERAAFAAELENQYPGYLEENNKLTTMVRILTGNRVLYALFYIAMTYFYDIQESQGWMNLFGSFFFFLWYSLMIRSGKFVAVAMLVFRGISISLAGPSILEMSLYLPFPLIFTLVLSVVMEFIEAVFCIYVLFNSFAAQTVRINRMLTQHMASGVPSATLEKMAEYQNPYTGEDAAADQEKAERKRAESGTPESENQERAEECIDRERKDEDSESGY